MIGLSPEDSHIFIIRKGRIRCRVGVATVRNVEEWVGAVVVGHPVKEVGEAAVGGRCRWEPQRVVTFKNREMREWAVRGDFRRRGGTSCVGRHAYLTC